MDAQVLTAIQFAVLLRVKTSHAHSTNPAVAIADLAKIQTVSGLLAPSPVAGEKLSSEQRLHPIKIPVL